jgi:hypothetical protein
LLDAFINSHPAYLFSALHSNGFRNCVPYFPFSCRFLFSTATCYLRLTSFRTIMFSDCRPGPTGWVHLDMICHYDSITPCRF